MVTARDDLSARVQRRNLIILAGPPGSGKGTQAALLGARYGLEHVNTGALLRHEIAIQSQLGRAVEPYVRAGEHTPTPLLNGVIAERVERAETSVVLDGYPRNLDQCEALDESLQRTSFSIQAVVAFQIADSSVIGRLIGRVVCETGAHAYHLRLQRPVAPGVCDVDGSPLVARPDDRDASALERRLEVYRKRTIPMLDRYDRQGLLFRVDAEGSPAQVAERLSLVLGKRATCCRQEVQKYPEISPDTRHAHARSGASGSAV